MQQIIKKKKKKKKEYRTRNWLGKVIHWKLCKKFKFDHMNKWYMHNPESVLENEMHKILRDFEIQTDHLISTRGPDLVIVNKKDKKKKRTCRIVEFAIPADHREKLQENEKRNKHLDLSRELNKLRNMKVTVIPIGTQVQSPKDWYRD